MVEHTESSLPDAVISVSLEPVADGQIGDTSLNRSVAPELRLWPRDEAGWTASVVIHEGKIEKAESAWKNGGKVEVFRKYRVWARGGAIYIYERLLDGPSPESSVLFIGRKRGRPPEAVKPRASQYGHRAVPRSLRFSRGHSETRRGGRHPRPVIRPMRQCSTGVEVDSANEAKPQTGQSGTVGSAIGGILGPTAN
jgi:hypothetical protein